MKQSIILNYYLIALLWAETDPDTDQHFDDNHGLADISDQLLESSINDVDQFIELSQPIFDKYDYLVDDGQIGHDLALTRNGHGAGFWDRGLGSLGDELTALVDSNFKTVNLFVNDDNKIDID